MSDYELGEEAELWEFYGFTVGSVMSTQWVLRQRRGFQKARPSARRFGQAVQRGFMVWDLRPLGEQSEGSGFGSERRG
jgi:hypothetical protein